MQFNVAYTCSKSIDTGSADPGSTAGGGKPDLPNVGFTAQGNGFDLDSNRAVSDFDRTHRFSASFVYRLPTFGSTSKFLTGWQLSGFVQAQSGMPYSIFSPEADGWHRRAVRQHTARLGRSLPPRLRPSRLCAARSTSCGRQGADLTEQAFNPSVLCSPLSLRAAIRTTAASATSAATSCAA